MVTKEMTDVVNLLYIAFAIGVIAVVLFNKTKERLIDMPSNKKINANIGLINGRQLKHNGISSDKTVHFRNISHKNNFGNSNWNNFRMMENSNVGSSSNRRPSDQVKLPLMKTHKAHDRNKNKFSMFERPHRIGQVTNIIAMDCEMVGVGHKGCESILARVSLVNSYGDSIYDKYVKPTVKVTDYRTFVSGIRPHDLENGEDFFKVQCEVAKILKGRLLVGHALNHDFQVLMLKHPWKDTRDTTTFMKFRREAKTTLSLKNLTYEFLNVKIQTGEHDSVEDAKAAMQLYMTYQKEWENERREIRMAKKNTTRCVDFQSKAFTQVDI